MNIAQIRELDVANGEGIRVSLFVSGCDHNCYNCFNKEYQDYNFGTLFNQSHITKIQTALQKDYCRGLSILGGEPLEFPLELKKIISKLTLKDHQDIWIWTGYLLEDILLDRDKKSLIEDIDVLVDGKFIDSKKDLSLKFRGSSNQRIINIPKTLESKSVVLLK